MRFNTLLCLSFLGALVSFSSVSARATYSRQLQLAERDAELISIRDEGMLDLRDDDFLDIRDEGPLDIRDEGLLDIRDVEDLYEILVRRAPKKTPAQAATRKAAAAAAANKHGKAPTPKGQPKTAKHVRTQQAANARKQANKLQGLPGNNERFQHPKGGRIYTGSEVRQAAIQSHREYNRQRVAANIPVGGRLLNGNHLRTGIGGVPSNLKTFGNHPNVAHPKTQPLPNLPHGSKYYEYPIDRVGRVITHRNQQGPTVFQGVVSHDTTRRGNHPGRNDHHLANHWTVPAKAKPQPKPFTPNLNKLFSRN